MKTKKVVIGWWSGGVTSAVACKIAIDLYGVDNCRIIFIDTFNEDEDTYRFKEDCKKWYGRNIESISSELYKCIEDVWYKYVGLNFANGAICSSELKRSVRLKFQKLNVYDIQVFGFDIDEPKRARSMKLNYPEAKAVYPLLFHALSKKDCIKIIQDAGIEIPVAYHLGLNNNNCLKTGCVQGGIGYWQKLRIIKPEVFEKMANVEHELSRIKQKPVTMLRDQKTKLGIFLKKNADYPHITELSDHKGREPKPLLECNGFCGTNDLGKSATDNELDFSTPSPSAPTSSADYSANTNTKS